jgi:hypothetical protein
VNWLRKFFGTAPPKPATDHLLKRADELADQMQRIDGEVRIVAKNARALAELHRLESHARR